MKEGDGTFIGSLEKLRQLTLIKTESLIVKLKQFLTGPVRLEVDSKETDPETIQARIIFDQFKNFLQENPEFKVGDIDSFIQIVNRWFPNFERDTRCKLNIQELVNRQSISCTGASLLLGIWCEQVFGITPLFIIDDEENQSSGKYAHTAVYLPDVNYNLCRKFDGKVYSDCQDLMVLGGDVYEYYLYSKLKKSNFPMDRNFRVYGNLSYIKHRWKALN